MAGRKPILYFSILLGLLAFFVYDSIRFGDEKLKIIFCDVGQGDGVYIRTPDGYDVVIDGGPDSSILTCLSENMPFWDKSLDLVVLTHPDSDHYTGLIPIAREYLIGSFATSFTPEDAGGYRTLRAILDEKGVTVRTVCQGDRYSFSKEVILRIVWPRSCTIASTEKNDNSVVAVLDYKNFEVLLTGDAEENIGDFYQDLAGDVDILKVPHHGSKDGVDGDYLQAVRPEVAILSVGEKNKYGHPSASVVDILEENKIRVLRTDRQGDIAISSDGDTYKIKSSTN